MARRTTKRTRRGNTAAIFALLTPTLMGSVAMGVDWGAISVARLQVQAAADAAAIAATAEMDDANVAEDIAGSYAAHVLINGVEPDVYEFTYGVWDSDSRTFYPGDVSGKNALRVRTEATIPMYFSSLFGLTEITVRGEAGAGPGVVPNRAPDHAVILDTTCSMSQYEIQLEREATEALVECVNQRSDPDSRGGIGVFGGVDWQVQEISTYGSDYDVLMDSMSEIRRCGSGTVPCSNTNQASGLELGLHMLEEVNDTRPDDVGQVVILMSDGEPIRYPICQYSYYQMEWDGQVQFPVYERCQDLSGGNYNRRYYDHIPRVSDITDWANAARDRAIADGIEIYTVFYGTDEDGNSWLRDNVTSDPDELHFQALTAQDIPDTFVDICVAFSGGSSGMLW